MVDSEQSLRFQRPSITPHALQKLRAGHFKPSLEIDLHGRTVKQAHSDILLAMGEARKEGDRCILIIHGKGSSYRDRDGMRRHTEQPVLKSHVNYWLQQISQVQAFCSAQPQDGGNGAVYVLLQQPKRRA
jgi:DNA-nicking Smr family endonuclease